MSRAVMWQPTQAHLRACLVGLGLVVVGAVWSRPDLVIVATGLVAVAVWAAVRRPAAPPSYRMRVGADRLREGEVTDVSVRPRDDTDVWDVALAVAPNPWLLMEPRSGAVLAGHERESVDVLVRSMRWGERDIGPMLVAASSAWAGFRWGPVTIEARQQVTVPVPATFDANAPSPHPAGLVGLNRSRRPGEGSEFATIRTFNAGDRLRRINWRVSLREQELHVTSTWADHDSHIMLVVDATSDIGISEGVDGRASSLDTGVRAAGAIAEHFLRHGDRVGLRILGNGVRTRMTSAAGRAHLERLLDTLATVSAGALPTGHLTMGIEAGALVIVLSPLMSRTAIEQALNLRRRGLSVVVVDTLPADFVADADDALVAVARRIRLLERDLAVANALAAGIPVTAWRGQGSLDPVLRSMAQRSAGPRLVQR